MNWFTQTVVASESLEKKIDLIDTWGGCEHVENAPNLLHIVLYENDSFGREGYCSCKDCHDAAKQEESNKTVWCHDGKHSVLKSDSIEWRWYDFYAAQGDEPLVLCRECAKGEVHRARVRQDQREYQEEFG